MAVIDSQVHLYEPNHEKRPWAQKIAGPEHVTGDAQIAEMDQLGIDGAIVVSTFQTYRYDASYAQEVYAKYPDRFALVKPVDTKNPAVGEIVTEWAGTPGAVGIRILLVFVEGQNPLDPGLDLTLSTSARNDLPVNLFVWNQLDEARIIIERHPDTLFVIDHVGLPQPYRPEGPDVWADLPKLLALANYGNQIDRRMLHVRRTVSLSRYLGSVGANHRQLWHRKVHVGNRLGTYIGIAELRTGTRRLPRDRALVSER
jgi:L-fuconolactonase